MNKAWPHKKLEEVLLLNRSGYWGDDAASPIRPTPVLVIRNADITKHNSIKGAAPRFFSAKEVANAELQVGDIAMSSSGDVGKAWLVNKAGYSASNFIRILRPDSKVLLPSFLRYVLESDEGQSALASSTAGTTIQNLQKTFYSTLAIPLPPLAEQQRIVRLLDEAFEGIEIAKRNAERNLQNVRALFESNLQAVFRQGEQLWAKKSIGEVCLTGSGGTPLSSRGEYYAGGTIPWLVSGEVAQGDVKSATHFITEAGLQNSSAKLFPAETVLVAMYGATAGQVGILRFESATNQAVCGIYPNERILSEFLYFALLSKKSELIAQATGNAQPNISQIKIKNTQVPLPEISEQRRVVSALKMMKESTALLENAYAKKILALKSLKSSCLHQAFFQDRKTA